MTQNIQLTKANLRESMRMACSWLTDIAQVKSADLSEDPRQPKALMSYADWRGAMKGEYWQAKKEWAFFCPIWHTGQAVSALARASEVLADAGLRQAAEYSGDFVMRHRISDPADEDFGMILAYENYADAINVSAVMEALLGMLDLYAMTGKEKYLHVCRDSLRWIAEKAYLEEEGLVQDCYQVAERRWLDKPFGTIGRPLVDDAVFLTVGKLAGDQRLMEIHFRILERLLQDEEPSGNWVNYSPCDAKRQSIHPRHAYWWGMPFIDSFLETGNERYLQAAIRCGQWYVKAQRVDGGLFRSTFGNEFNTMCFGHATSGIACAVKMWVRLYEITGRDEWLEPIAKALRFCLMMQMIEPKDGDLRGAIVEKLLAPDGTDASLFYIRDLGTIFYVQAVCAVLQADLLSRLP